MTLSNEQTISIVFFIKKNNEFHIRRFFVAFSLKSYLFSGMIVLEDFS